MLGHELALKRADLESQAVELSRHAHQRGADDVGHPERAAPSQPRDEVQNLGRALSRDDPELREVRSDRIQPHRALAHEQVSCPVQHQHALLLGALDRHKRMLDRVTASQIASASAASFFCRFTYGLT